MNYVQQIFQLPYAPFWVPALILLAFVAAYWWLARHASPLIGSREPAPELPGTVILTTASPLKPSLVEQRQFLRREGNPIDVMLANPDQKNDPIKGFVIDRSQGGMRLAIFREIDVGSIVSVRPNRAADMVPWTDLEVRCCVRSAEIPGEFELGCQFVKSVPYSILLLFG